MNTTSPMRYLYIIFRPDDIYTIVVHNSMKVLSGVTNIKFALMHVHQDPLSIIQKFLTTYPLTFVPQTLTNKNPDIIDSRSYTVHLRAFPVYELYISLQSIQLEPLIMMNNRINDTVVSVHKLHNLEKAVSDMRTEIVNLSTALLETKMLLGQLEKKIEEKGRLIIINDHFKDDEEETKKEEHSTGTTIEEYNSPDTHNNDGKSVWQSIFGK